VTASRAEVDLMEPHLVRAFFERERPECVVLSAARVGGILANQTHPAEFMNVNLTIQTSVIEAARLTGVRRLLFFGCGCVYPRQARQPMKEEDLFAGPVEPTSEPYAVAKLAGMTMCAAYNRQYGVRFQSVIPASIYGPNDNFDLANSHVLAALIRKFLEASRDGQPVVLWGTGTPRREFLYVDDLADACLFLLALDDQTIDAALGPFGAPLNVGTGHDIAIRDLAGLIKEVTGARCALEFDTTKPDGASRKLLDSGRIARLGWRPKTSLEDGIRRTCEWYNRAL
jgi:GDP-L-fucose synthase